MYIIIYILIIQNTLQHKRQFSFKRLIDCSFQSLYIGKLHSPANILGTVDGATVFLGWTPPFLFHGISIHEYLVNITVISMSNGSVNQHLNTTNQSVSFATFDYSFCTVYFTCVQAVSLAGIGQQGCTNSSRIGGYLLFTSV